MTRIVIELELYDECADEDHSTGLQNDAYEEIVSALTNFGDIADISKKKQNQD